MRLFIAEKPSLGRAIAENLGKGVAKDGCIECSGGQDIVTWCFGHILEQCDPGIRGKQVEIINTLLADVKPMEIEGIVRLWSRMTKTICLFEYPLQEKRRVVQIAWLVFLL